MKNSLNIKIFALAVALVSIATLAPLFASACSLAISGIKVSDIEDNTAVINWTTSDYKTTAYVYAGESMQSLDKVYWDANNANSHSLEIGGLEADTKYYYKIVATNRNNESKTSDIKSFSTSGVKKDTQVPGFNSAYITDNQNGSLTLHITTDETTSVSVDYGTDSGYGRNATDSVYSTSHDITLRQLEAGATYYFRITIKDQEGNTNSKYLSSSVYEAPRETLEINNINVETSGSGYSSNRSATIRFGTSVASRSRLSYGASATALFSNIDVSVSRAITHGIKIDGLTPNTAYYYRIEAYDSLGGNSVRSEIKSFWTGDVRKWYVTGSFVRAIGDKRVYIIYAGTKAWIENPAAFLGLGFKGEWIQDVPAWTLEDYQETYSVKNFNVHPSGSLVKYAYDPTVYLIEGQYKHPISSPQAFVRNGFSWDHIVTIPWNETYITGSNVN
jgi:phosphodiesterase/alkaline phosphatase D-like protein